MSEPRLRTDKDDDPLRKDRANGASGFRGWGGDRWLESGPRSGGGPQRRHSKVGEGWLVQGCERAEDLTLIEDEARFVGDRAVEVDGVVGEADHVVIHTRARPTIPDIDGVSDSGYLNSSSILDISPNYPNI